MASATGRVRFISLVVTGTRADLQPYLALASALLGVGFVVTVVTHAVHREECLALGVDFCPLKGDPTYVMRSTAFRDGVLEGSMLRIAALFKAEADAYIEPNMRLILDGCTSADAILCSITCLTECMAIAQKKQIPLLLCPQLPFSPSGEVRMVQSAF
jgi:sterol 3beta-glucosyltransferase